MDSVYYFSHKGYHGKLVPHEDQLCGEVLNSNDEVFFSADTEKDILPTFREGIEAYIKRRPKETAEGLTAGELIAELALAMEHADTVCRLKDGTPITGIHIDFGEIVLDTGNGHIREIAKALKEN